MVVRSIGGEHHVLVILDPYRNWGLPKGHLEKGEGSPEAAVREVGEETGLSDLRLVQELATIDWHFRAGEKLVHKVCAFFLMTSEAGEPRPELAEGITECVWLPLGDAVARISYDDAREVVLEAKEILEGHRG